MPIFGQRQILMENIGSFRREKMNFIRKIIANIFCGKVKQTTKYSTKQEVFIAPGKLITDNNEFSVSEQELDAELNSLFPTRQTDGSAGIDLKAYVNDEYGIVLNPGETKLINTGFKWAIPKGYVGMVCSRSGLALKYSVFVLNAPGIVDSDYRGDVGVIIHNAGKELYAINDGDRIAQMVLIKVENLSLVAKETVDDTVRGIGGFGSTGK